MSNGKAFTVEAFKKELATLGFREVFGDAGPDEFAGGIGHPAADDDAFLSGLFHHAVEEMFVQIRRGVVYGETCFSGAVADVAGVLIEPADEAGSCLPVSWWEALRWSGNEFHQRGMKMMGSEPVDVSPAWVSCWAVNCAICRSMGLMPSVVRMKLSGFASTMTVPSAGRYQPK